MRSFLFATVFIAALNSPALARCGVERWPVKTGTDINATQVSLAPLPTTVAALTRVVAPPNPEVLLNRRFAPTELQTFTVSGLLVAIKREPDEDYHLVIADDTTPATTMIVEAPNPRCARGSRFFRQIADVRATIDDEFGPIRGRLAPFVPVRVTGIAFYDRLHGQEGVAPNGIELHPILSIEFR